MDPREVIRVDQAQSSRPLSHAYHQQGKERKQRQTDAHSPEQAGCVLVCMWVSVCVCAGKNPLSMNKECIYIYHVNLLSEHAPWSLLCKDHDGMIFLGWTW